MIFYYTTKEVYVIIAICKPNYVPRTLLNHHLHRGRSGLVQTKKSQSFLRGAAILTATTLIVKILSALYKIPLGRILSDETFAHFNVSSNIYALALILAASGLPMAISKLVAYADASGNRHEVTQIFHAALKALVIMGIVIALAMVIFANRFALLMNDPKASASITVLAPATFFVCVAAVYKGYAQGLRNMTPSSISQIIETVIKLGVGLALSVYLINAGKSSDIVSAGAAVGQSVGAALGMIYLIATVKRPRYATLNDTNILITERFDSSNTEHSKKERNILISLFKLGIPISLGSSVTAIITLIGAALTLHRLALYSSGMETGLYGAFAKLQTLSNIPASFFVPLTMSIMPAISSGLATGDTKTLASVNETTSKLLLLLALPCAIGICILSDPLLRVVYPASYSTEAVMALRILGAASFFACNALTGTAVLQARSYEIISVVIMSVGIAIMAIVTYMLTPFWGISGAATGLSSCFITISVASSIVLRLRADHRLPKGFAKAVLANLFMGITALVLLYVSVNIAQNRAIIALVLPILGAVPVYAISVISLGIVTADDLASAPRGTKIAKLLRLK